MTLPASNVLGNDTVTQGAYKTAIEQLRDHTAMFVGSQQENALTISGGSVTPTVASCSIDTEASASSDDLTNIAATNFDDDMLLMVRAFHTDRTVVLKHLAGGAGQLRMKSNLDAALDDDRKVVIFRYDSTNARWQEVLRNWNTLDVLNNITATVDPDADDDVTLGYSVGSLWINVSSDEAWRCVDATDGAAIWENITLTTADLGTAALVNTGTGAGDVPTVTNANSLYVAQGVHTIYFPALAMKPRTTAGAEQVSVELATNKIMVETMDFDQSATEYVQFSCVMPKSWDEGTITAQFNWTAASGSGNVIWGIRARAFGDNDALDQAFGTAVEVTDALITADDEHQSAVSGAMTVAGSPANKDRVIFEIYRDAADGGDTLTADAKLIGVSLFINLNAKDDS